MGDDLTDFFTKERKVGSGFAVLHVQKLPQALMTMTNFKILFSYYEKTYSALVKRVSGNPVQYMVSIEPPHHLNFQNPFVLTADVSSQRIEYGRQYAYGSICFTMLLAIKAYCYENGIPLLKD